MPPKPRLIRKVLAEQAWIDAYQDDDPCLFDTLVSAYVARGHAERAGAAPEALADGDDALAQIRLGRATGTEAWDKARVGLRRYSEAFGATARPRQGHALRKRYGRAESPPRRVLLFHTAAHPTRAARLHAVDCPMVNTAKRRGGVVRAHLDPDQESIDDLNERGFPVRECKCLKKT